jgi:hypothetical protein
MRVMFLGCAVIGDGTLMRFRDILYPNPKVRRAYYIRDL